jgi:hypothetical protein
MRTSTVLLAIIALLLPAASANPITWFVSTASDVVSTVGNVVSTMGAAVISVYDGRVLIPADQTTQQRLYLQFVSEAKAHNVTKKPWDECIVEPALERAFVVPFNSHAKAQKEYAGELKDVIRDLTTKVSSLETQVATLTVTNERLERSNERLEAAARNTTSILSGLSASVTEMVGRLMNLSEIASSIETLICRFLNVSVGGSVAMVLCVAYWIGKKLLGQSTIVVPVQTSGSHTGDVALRTLELMDKQREEYKALLRARAALPITTGEPSTFASPRVLLSKDSSNQMFLSDYTPAPLQQTATAVEGETASADTA